MIFVNPRAVRSSSKTSAFVPATMAGTVAAVGAAFATGAAVTVVVAVAAWITL
jgi:hypothetical protein